MALDGLTFSSDQTERDLQVQQFMTQHSAGHWVAVDEKAIIRGIQTKLSVRLGYHRPTRIVGQSISMLVPAHMTKDGKHDQLVSDYFDHSAPRSMGDRSAINIVDSEGVHHPVLISLNPFDDTFCDGMCLKDYENILELTFAEIFFSEDLRLTRLNGV